MPESQHWVEDSVVDPRGRTCRDILCYWNDLSQYVRKPSHLDSTSRNGNYPRATESQRYRQSQTQATGRDNRLYTKF
jgi:hypothetical protein